MTVSFMVNDQEITALLYLKEDRKIAHYLGISEARVADVRSKNHRVEPHAEPVKLPEVLEQVMEQPVQQESPLTPSLCPTCGSPVHGRLLVMHIQALVAAYYQIPVREMTSARRHREVAYPRQIAMYLAYEGTPKSLPEIGRRFGNRDHTTVIYAIKQVQKRMLGDPVVESDIKALRERLAA